MAQEHDPKVTGIQKVCLCSDLHRGLKDPNPTLMKMTIDPKWTQNAHKNMVIKSYPNLLDFF